jgi:hypothetical protein
MKGNGNDCDKQGVRVVFFMVSQKSKIVYVLKELLPNPRSPLGIPDISSSRMC